MASKFSITAVFGAVDGASRVMGRIESNAQRVLRGVHATSAAAARGLGAVSRQTDKAVVAIASAGKTAAIVGAGGLAAGFATAVTRGAAFEQAMADVAAVSGAAGAELAALKARAIELGSTTKFTGVEVAGAMESMTKAGFGTREVLQGVSGLISAAAADGGDLGEISAGLMATLKGFGAGSDRLQAFADMAAKAGDSTAASIGSINESMIRFGPVARQLGVSAASSFAQVSLLQDAGMDAASAGTQLAAVYSKLVSPIGATKKELAALGVQVTDAAGNMRAPEDLFAAILKSTDGIAGNAGRMAAFTNLVGLESKTAMLNIAAAAKSGKLDQLTKDLGQAAGYADQIAAKRMQTLSGDWKLFGGAVDGVVNSLYDLQGGALRGVVQSATAWVRANKDLIILKIDTFVQGTTVAIRDAIPHIKAFGTGLIEGLRGAKAGFDLIRPPLETVMRIVGRLFGNDDKSRAESMGKALVVVAGGLVAISAAARAASVVKGTIGGIQKAVDLFSSSTRGSTDAVTKGSGALGNAAKGMGKFERAAGAATLAIGAWMLAWDQAQELAKYSGGWEGVWAGVKSTFTEGSFFKGVDERANKIAKEEARLRAEKKKQQPKALSFIEAPAAAAASISVGDVQTNLAGTLGAVEAKIKQLTELGTPASAAELATFTTGIERMHSVLAAASQAVPAFSTTAAASTEAARSIEQIDRLTASLSELQASVPSLGRTIASPAGSAAPGQAYGSAPAAAPVGGVAAPQLTLPREQSAEMARLIGVEVRRGMKEAMKETPIQVSVAGDGTATASTTPGQRTRPRVSDSGAM